MLLINKFKFLYNLFKNISLKYIFKYKYISLNSKIYSYKNVSKSLKIDDYSYIGPNCIIYPKTYIGKYSMIANNVQIIGNDHIYNKIGSPIIFSGRPMQKSTFIGNDTWIGASSIIKCGVKIGNCAIIAFGSIVVNDVLDYEIVGGNPAKHIKFRFESNDKLIHQSLINENTFKKKFPNKLF
jgi:acetyltransferase-like isoleucine patch superfamily enzyme